MKRLAWLVMVAVFALVMLAVSYQQGMQRSADEFCRQLGHHYAGRSGDAWLCFDLVSNEF